MNLLSLFNGLGGAYLALQKLGAKIDKYYSSEIDVYGNSVAKKVNPNIINLGDVTKIDYNKLEDVDLLIGGSPCQNFSFAGTRSGMVTTEDIEITKYSQYIKLKNDGFEFYGQSYLFWEYIRALKEIKPKYFLLENVVMEKRWENIISNTLGVQPIMINSSLLTAQNRRRLYWTNIPGRKETLMGWEISQPKDKGIMLQDILEYDIDKQYYLNDNMNSKYITGNQLNPEYNSQANTIHDTNKKCGTLCAGTHGYVNGYINSNSNKCIQVGVADDIKGFDQNRRIYSDVGKCTSLISLGGDKLPKVVCGAFRGRYLVDGVRQDGKMKTAGMTEQKLELRNDEKTNTITTVEKDNQVCYISNDVPKYIHKNIERDHKKIQNTNKDIFKMDSNVGFQDNQIGLNKSSVIRASNSTQLTYDKKILTYRKLTPLECERLQSVPDGTTEFGLDENNKIVKISNTQRYKMLGNGFTIDVIAHILKGMSKNYRKKYNIG